MADEIDVAQSTQETDSTATEKEQSVSVEDLQKQITELSEQMKTTATERDDFKKRLSGKDKVLTDALQERDALKKANMTIEEQAKAKQEEDRRVLIEEIKALQYDSLSLTDETSSLIDADTGQAVKEKAELLKNYKESVLGEANKKIEELTKQVEVLKGNVPAPTGVEKKTVGTKESLQSQYDEAVKNGNGDLAFAIKEQMSKL